MKCWAQTWTESEKGWGRRPDGHSLHIKKSDIGKYLAVLRIHEAKAHGAEIPDVYSFPDSPPTLVEVTDERTIERLKASDHGVWGPKKDPPEALAVAEEMAIPMPPQVQLLKIVRQLEELTMQVMRPPEDVT